MRDNRLCLGLSQTALFVEAGLLAAAVAGIERADAALAAVGLGTTAAVLFLGTWAFRHLVDKQEPASDELWYAGMFGGATLLGYAYLGDQRWWKLVPIGLAVVSGWLIHSRKTDSEPESKGQQRWLRRRP